MVLMRTGLQSKIEKYHSILRAEPFSGFCPHLYYNDTGTAIKKNEINQTIDY